MGITMNGQIICTPAYGRDYTNQADLLVDWESGKDFCMANRHRAYINKQDAENFGVPGGVIKVRYSRKEKFCLIPVDNSNEDM
jgi:hypothetical protein